MPKNPWEMDWGGGDPAPWEMEWEAPAEIASNPVRDQLLEEKKKRGLKTLGGALSPEAIGGLAPETRLPGEAPDIPYRRAPEVDEAATEGPWDRVFDLSNVPDIGTRALEGVQRWNIPSNILESGRKVLSHGRVGSEPTAEDTPTARDLASVFGGAGAIPPVGEFIEEKLGPLVNPAIAGAYGLANKYGPASVIRRTIAPDADESTLEAAALLPARGLGQVFDTLATDPTNAVLMAASGGAAPVVKGAQIAAEGAFLHGMGSEIAPAAARMGEAYEERGVKGAIQEAPGVVVPAAFATMLGTKLAKHAGPEAVDYARNRRAYSAAQSKAKAATDYEAKVQERAKVESELQPAVDAAASKEPVAVAKAQEMKARLDQLKTELEGTPESPVIQPEPLNRWELERLERGRPKLGEKFEGGAPGSSRTAPENEGAGMPAEEIGRILSVNPDDPIVKRTNIQVWNSVDDPGFLEAIDNPRLGMQNPRLALEERLRAGETPADISRTFNVPAFATPDGTLHVMAPRVESVSHLNELLDHETTHVALQAAAGTGEVHPVLGKAAEATLKALAARAQEEAGPGGRVAEHYAGEPVRNVGEEVLAHGTEFTDTRQAPSVVDRGVAAVRDTLRARLPERFRALVGKASDAEIRVMLDRARKIIQSQPDGKLQVGAKTAGKPNLTDVGREIAGMDPAVTEGLRGVPEWDAVEAARAEVMAKAAEAERAIAPVEAQRAAQQADVAAQSLAERERAIGRPVIEQAAQTAAERAAEAERTALLNASRPAERAETAEALSAGIQQEMGRRALPGILERPVPAQPKPKTAEKAPGKVPVEPQPTTVPPAAGPETRQAPPGETPSPLLDQITKYSKRNEKEFRFEPARVSPHINDEAVRRGAQRDLVAYKVPLRAPVDVNANGVKVFKANASVRIVGVYDGGRLVSAANINPKGHVVWTWSERGNWKPSQSPFWGDGKDALGRALALRDPQSPFMRLQREMARQGVTRRPDDLFSESGARSVNTRLIPHEAAVNIIDGFRGYEDLIAKSSRLDVTAIEGGIADLAAGNYNTPRAFDVIDWAYDALRESYAAEHGFKWSRPEPSVGGVREPGGVPAGGGPPDARSLQGAAPDRGGAATPTVGGRGGEPREVKLSRRAEETPAEAKAPIFYSKLKREVEAGQGKWKPDDLLRFLRARGVKAEEMEWSRIEDLVRGKDSITKQELLDHLEENAVRVEEVVRGGSEQNLTLGQAKELAARGESVYAVERANEGQVSNAQLDDGRILPYIEKNIDRYYLRAGDANAAVRRTVGTKFDEYQLPGGENYRELLLKLPSDFGQEKLQWRPASDPDIGGFEAMDGAYQVYPTPSGEWNAWDRQATKSIGFFGTPEAAKEAVAARLSRERGASFQSIHFAEPNILAHVRFNERKGPNGERILHIEEVQSDWHQKGRDIGYGRESAEQARERGHALQLTGVPDAPFKNNKWEDLALKRMLRWAADEGFDRITWGTGDQQATRYKEALLKKIDEVRITRWPDGRYEYSAKKDGRGVHSEPYATADGIREMLGKAGDQLIEAADATPSKEAVVRGDDMNIGGKGMRKAYDERLVNKMNDLARKLDSSLKVGTTLIPITDEAVRDFPRLGSRVRDVYPNEGENVVTVHSIDLTPKAREAAKAGLPLFSRRSAPRDIPLAAPQVKARMARLGEAESRLMETDPNYRVKSLKRDTPQTWESLDKAIREKSETWTDDQIAAAAQKSGRTFNAVEQQTVAARAQLRHAQMMERAHARVEAFDMSAAERKAKGVDLDRLIRDEVDATLVATAMERASVNAGTEAGRALGARGRIMDVGPEPNPDVLIRKLIKETGAKDADVAEMYLLYKAGETRKFAEKMRDVMRPGWAQKVMEYWRGGLLSGLGTHGANFSGNTGEVAFRLAETMASAGIDKVWSKLADRPRERFTAEARHELAAQIDAMPEAFKRLTGDLVDQVLLQHEPPADMSRKFDYQVGAIGGRAGRLVRTPFRALGIADDFFKALGGEAALRKRAYREARGEKLTGKDADIRAIRIANEARQLVDERWRRLMEEVGQEKLERVFQEDPVRIVQALSQLTHEHPLAGLVFPFVKTPANITRVAWQRSPMGLVTGKAPALVKKYRAQQKALAEGRSIPEAELVTKGQVSDALARPAVGIALTTAISALAAAGFLTGSGPVDREENKAQRATGWQPYSIRIPTGDPERPYRYVPYNRFEPAASLIGSVADLFESHDERKVSQKVLGSLAVNWTNKTYFRSLNDIARAITDPNMSAKGVAASYASSFAVPAIVAKGAEAGDPYFRERRSASGLEGVGEAAARGIGRRLPGLSRTLEPIYTPLGEPAKRPGNALTRFALPIQPSQSQPGTELEAYLVKIHAVPSEVPRELEIPKALLPRGLDQPIDSMRIELTDSERAVLAKARRDAALTLRRSLPSLRSLPVDERRDRIEKTFRDANRRAISSLWVQNRELRDRARAKVKKSL